MDRPQDVLKNPYIFEFVGIRENKPKLEKDLEAKLMRHIEDFPLELDRGFMYVGSQQRVPIGNTHSHVDMVFYNKILKACALIDLKMGEFQPEHAGQMNCYGTEINDEDDTPVGITLCKTCRDVVVERALGGLANQVFASTCVYHIPDKEVLIGEVKALLEQENSESEVENDDGEQS